MSSLLQVLDQLGYFPHSTKDRCQQLSAPASQELPPDHHHRQVISPSARAIVELNKSSLSELNIAPPAYFKLNQMESHLRPTHELAELVQNS